MNALPQGMPHHVGVVLTDRLPIFELAVPCEVFGIDRSDLRDPWYTFSMIAGEPGPLVTVGGLEAASALPLETMRGMDTIIVPACARAVQTEPPEELMAELRAAAQRGARIVALCTGSYILARAGLLEGRAATTHWMNWQDFGIRFPHVDLRRNVLFTEDGNLFTSAGTAAAIDVCLELVRQDYGAGVAASVARRMVVPLRRDGGQAQYVDPPAHTIPADEVGQVMEWAAANLHGPLGAEHLARRARMSRRTFYRRFLEATGTTPVQWVLSRRIDEARRLLETTDFTIERITTLTGMGTPANLRRRFQQSTTLAPSRYRAQYRSSTKKQA